MERLSLAVILSVVIGYFIVLLLISIATSKGNNLDTFFTGNKKSPWLVVAYGMIGAALSGVTFVSIPGLVYKSGFYFTQFILGNIVGYMFITFILIPMYFKMNLTSIYTFLNDRFGVRTHKTGSIIFIISQTLGASLRMLLAVIVLREIFTIYFLKYFNEESLLPIWMLSAIFLLFIFIYTFRAGIKTIVWTDLLQTTFLLLAAVFVVVAIYKDLNLSFLQSIEIGKEMGLTKMFDFSFGSGTFLGKQFISGIFIAIAMMGLDQNMIQKSLTIAKVQDAQKNTFFFSIIVALSQLFFLFLGMMLLIYAQENQLFSNLPSVNGVVVSDRIFPYLAVTEMSFGFFTAILFILGVVAAAFSSADSAVAAITTSICYDILDQPSERINAKKRIRIQMLVMMMMWVVIFGFSFAGRSVVNLIFSTAAYTYSPLLALFFIGIFTRYKLNDVFTPIACILGPLFAYGLGLVLKAQFNFDMGFFTIITGAFLTTFFLFLGKSSSKTIA